jgi:TrmH family RNA methyltransferase
MATRPLVDFVLLRARRPANVAAACRAMKNMGFNRLVLVEPPEGLDRPEARALAYGAWDVLDAARLAPSLRAAVSQASLVVGSSGRVAGPKLTPRELASSLALLAHGGDVALVFGPEDQGLTREELGLCHACVRIPSDPAHPSLNLAQAVLILAYEVRLATTDGVTPERPAPVPAGEFEEAIDALREALLVIGYLNPQNPGSVLGEIRDLLFRGVPTAREVQLLRGLARQVTWAGKSARGKGLPADVSAED